MPVSVTPSGPSRRGRLAVLVLLLAALSVAMAQTIVVAALPVFSRHDAVSATTATWLLTIFMLASAVVTPIAGRLGDLHGHKRVMVAGLLVLCLGSIIAAISDLAGWLPGLLLGRALQGCSGGVFPVVFGLARGFLSPQRLHNVVAALSAMFGVGGALGMVVAGPLVDLAGTPWLFWISLIMAGVCLVGVPRLAEDQPRRALGERNRLDLSGSVLLGVTFVLIEARASSPIIDLRLLIQPALAGTNVATVVISVGMFAAVTLVPSLLRLPPRPATDSPSPPWAASSSARSAMSKPAPPPGSTRSCAPWAAPWAHSSPLSSSWARHARMECHPERLRRRVSRLCGCRIGCPCHCRQLPTPHTTDPATRASESPVDPRT